MIYKLVSVATIVVFFACAGQAQKPPLILEPNKYSYTFGMPEGWAHSFEQAHSFGTRLVLFPKGGDLHRSNSIIYVNELSGGILSAIVKTIANAKCDNPDIKMENWPSISINAGGAAIVRITEGYKDPRRAKEALAFIEHKDTVVLVVLTTKNTANWDADYKAFVSVVSGHRYFDCNSTNLAVPCAAELRN